MKFIAYVAFAIAFACSAACAQAQGESLAEAARVELADKLVRVSDSIAACRDAGIPLEKPVFSGLELTRDQLKTALAYHLSKAGFECSRKEINDYLLSASILAYADTVAGADVLASNELIIHDAITMFKLKPEYMAIPAAQRELLDAIPELQRPFDLVKTAQNLGL